MFDINKKNFADDWNRGPLVSEATTIPTEPQPLPEDFAFLCPDFAAVLYEEKGTKKVVKQ